MNLADNLKKIRKEHHLSQEQLAEKLGVSRQSVSKWESNLAYPEMDKMLQLCKMFNLNIDELLNQDIKEANDNKQAKMNVNKYIDDFFGYVTKTIDMFTSMTWKEKIKCLFEQIVIIFSMIMLFAIIGAIGGSIVFHLFYFLPSGPADIMSTILSDIYLILCLILGTVLELHIFKVRYLDYYTIIKENANHDNIEEGEGKQTSQEIKNEEGKIIYQPKQQKIIIRDPNHSSYKFIGGLLKCLLIGMKMVVAFMAMGFCFSLICLVIGLVLSFLFVKTGMTFVGAFLILMASIVINLIVLTILYHFIISKKNQKKRLALAFVISLFLIGVGTGLMFVSFTKYDVIDDISSGTSQESEKVIPMTENLFIHDNYYDIEYVEAPLNDIKIVSQYSDYYDFDIHHDAEDDSISFHLQTKNQKMMDMIRKTLSDINEKKIVVYSNCKITIYTSKENMEKLQLNKKVYYQKREDEERERLYNEVNSLRDELSEKEIELDSLKSQLEYYENEE